MQTISLPLSPPCQSNSLILANDEMKKKKKKKKRKQGKIVIPDLRLRNILKPVRLTIGKMLV